MEFDLSVSELLGQSMSLVSLHSACLLVVLYNKLALLVSTYAYHGRKLSVVLLYLSILAGKALILSRQISYELIYSRYHFF